MQHREIAKTYQSLHPSRTSGKAPMRAMLDIDCTAPTFRGCRKNPANIAECYIAGMAGVP